MFLHDNCYRSVNVLEHYYKILPIYTFGKKPVLCNTLINLKT